MSEKMELPRSVWEGSFTLFGVEVRCHTLNDGQRIIEAGCLERLFDELANGENGDISDMDDFLLWFRGTA